MRGPIFGTGVTSTCKPVLQIGTNATKEDDFTGEQGRSWPDASWEGLCSAFLTPLPRPALGEGERHTPLGKDSGHRVEQRHFPELSLLNMVQIIGYVDMHNAFYKHLLYIQILLHATHSAAQVVETLS